MSVRVLFLDLNSYFASVEQQLRPELRGKPVGIVPFDTDSTCCLAASYEAKAFGVKTGTRVGDAKALCPGIALVRARHRTYVEMHHRIVDAVERCVPVEAVHSIDEMACRLGIGQREPDEAVRLAMAVKRSIAEHAGAHLRCSIGLAPNRFLAKVGTDLQKPDGLTVIEPRELPNKLYSLKLTDLPGIASRMHVRLAAAGVRTVPQLCALPKPAMRQIWNGVVGEWWWHWLRGDDVNPGPTHRRSIGHQHVLPPELRHEEGARAVAIRLLLKAAARMRSIEYRAVKLTLTVKNMHQPGWSASASLGEGCRDTLAMVDALVTLWAQRPPGQPKFVGVAFPELLAPGSATVPLFEHERKRDELAGAIDAINTRYGKHAVYTGAIHGVLGEATGGIAFANIPDLNLPDTVA